MWGVEQKSYWSLKREGSWLLILFVVSRPPMDASPDSYTVTRHNQPERVFSFPTNATKLGRQHTIGLYVQFFYKAKAKHHN